MRTDLTETTRPQRRRRAARHRTSRSIDSLLARGLVDLATAATYSTTSLALAALCDGLVERLRAKAAAAYLLNEERRELEAIRLAGSPSAPLRLRLDEGSPQAQSLSGKPSAVVEGTSVFVPLRDRRRVLGMLLIQCRDMSDAKALASVEALPILLGLAVDAARRQETDMLRRAWVRLIAHDFRQPMNAIALHASVVGRLAPDGPIRSSVEHITENVRRLDRRITALSELLLLEMGELELRMKSTDVVRVLDDARERLASHAPGHVVRVELRVQVARAAMDPQRIEQILAIGVSNAARHGERGGAIVVVVTASDREVFVAVRNRARPESRAKVDADALSFAFDPFGRGRPERDEPGDGIGGSLHLARCIAEAHGGSLTLESDGEGTTALVLRLPRVQ